MPLVDIVPEPLAALQARYPRALEYVYDQLAIIRNGAIRPGEVAACIFDFEDGLRLIVARERGPDGVVVLHYSASFLLDSRLADEVRLLALGRGGAWALQKWAESVPGRFAELSGDQRPATFLGFSDGCIPHWHIEE